MPTMYAQNCNMNSCQNRTVNGNCNYNNCNHNNNSGCNSGCSSSRTSRNHNSHNRNQNCNCGMEQKNLKRYIDLVSFAALDCAMFLDTHPSDSEALEFFAYYKDARKQALKEYSSRFSPLTLDTVPKGTDFWAWANEPWPWEMEG